MNNKVSWDNFYREIAKEDSNINLGNAALSYAKVQFSNLDIDKYINILDSYASDIQPQLPAEAYPLKTIKVINRYLFEELKFQGNDRDYYNASNSFLNEVIDRKLGIPITLSVIYLEVAKRIDFPMVGIGMPGHFLIRPEFEGAGIYIDTFNKGEILFEQDCQNKLSQLYQQPVKLKSDFLAPVSNRQILARMLGNLKNIYLHYRDFDRALFTIEGILMLFPDNANEFRDRGLLFYQLNRWQEAIPDLESYLNILPNADDAPMIQALLNKISC